MYIVVLYKKNPPLHGRPTKSTKLPKLPSSAQETTTVMSSLATLADLANRRPELIDRRPEFARATGGTKVLLRSFKKMLGAMR